MCCAPGAIQAETGAAQGEARGDGCESKETGGRQDADRKVDCYLDTSPEGACGAEIGCEGCGEPEAGCEGGCEGGGEGGGEPKTGCEGSSRPEAGCEANGEPKAGDKGGGKPEAGGREEAGVRLQDLRQQRPDGDGRRSRGRAGFGC